ncbi:helix-turn-helix domain-containing protein [Paenibacillus polymyxa]|uniref:AlbA family DNA-binding domain-containing protein n=1 Tax=Paenibacillus polymyxa TaxID=1406 RepID=UPI0004700A47|nr:ATP-binding protein [Paenibacillus polymyxa]
MSDLNQRDIEYIRSLIMAGRENTIVDFKEEWYKLKYNYQKFEFIKDCISFLNVGIEIDKYIIIGYRENKEDGTLSNIIINERYEENNIQEIITENIEPIPQIDIIMNFDLDGHQIDLIKIRKENKDQPYLFRKDFEGGKKDSQEKDTFKNKSKGLGYIRHGSSSHLISRSELTNMFFKKQGNIHGYFNLATEVKGSLFSDMLIFLDSMDVLINREALDIVTNSSSIFKYKITKVFQEMILQGGIFLDDSTREVEEFSYIITMIKNYKHDCSKIDISLDGGENSLIILLFCACYNLYRIASNNSTIYEVINDAIIINFVDDNFNGEHYRAIDKYVGNLNELIKILRTFPLHHLNFNTIVKIREVNYDSSISKQFVKSNVKFRVSEEIIPLLIEPLYKNGNKIEIALRELLQNSIDACKLKQGDGYRGKIEISIRTVEEKLILSFEDNGIGMSLEDVIEYYLTVGKSKKKKSDLPIVGQFGIGALSMFLIGKKAKVLTKKSNDNEFRFELFEDKNRVSDLIQKSYENNESYTRIEIEIEPNMIDKSNFKELIKQLGIYKWALNNQNIDIIFHYNSDSYMIPNISEKRNMFSPLIETDSIRAFLYDFDLEENEKKDSKHENLDRTIKTKNLLLYNDVLINGTYNFNQYRNLNKANIPFLVVDGKTSEDEIAVELSRSSAKIGGSITKAIVEKIYRKEILKIIEYLKEYQGNTNSIKMKNEIIQLCNGYLNLPKLLLSRNHLEIANSKMNLPNYSKTIIVRSNSLNEDCVKFNEDNLFLTEQLDSGKANLADMIVSSNRLFISARFLNKYILAASGSSNGFRMEALKYLLKDMLPVYNWNLDYVGLWNGVRTHKTEIEKAIKEKSVYGIYSYGNISSDQISEIFNSSIEGRDLIVSFSNTQDYNIFSSYDETFDEILNQEFYNANNTLEGIMVGEY